MSYSTSSSNAKSGVDRESTERFQKAFVRFVELTNTKAFGRDERDWWRKGGVYYAALQRYEIGDLETALLKLAREARSEDYVNLTAGDIEREVLRAKAGVKPDWFTVTRKKSGDIHERASVPDVVKKAVKVMGGWERLAGADPKHIGKMRADFFKAIDTVLVAEGSEPEAGDEDSAERD